MRRNLAEAWCLWVSDQPDESKERLQAASNLTKCLLMEGKFAQAEAPLLSLLTVRTRLLGAGHLVTLAVAGNLASSFQGQGKFTKAEQILRRALEHLKGKVGTEHPETLTAAAKLPISRAHSPDRANTSMQSASYAS